MSKIIKWNLNKNSITNELDAKQLYKFVVAPYNGESRDHLFCICYARNEIRIFENCIERASRRNDKKQIVNELLLSKLVLNDDIDRQIIEIFKKTKQYDLDFGPAINSSKYVTFDSVPKAYPFLEKNGIHSIEIEIKD